MTEPSFTLARACLEPAAWRALEGAYTALLAGGLPCGAALADDEGVVIAEGRNHAHDPPAGDDALQGTPLAHAELNVLARVPTGRDLVRDTLWSTQQPCAMCAAAIAFCGVGRNRFIASDPAFAGTSDPRAGTIRDPTETDPVLAPWSVIANVMFLHPTITRGGRHDERIRRNLAAEPETTELALAVAAGGVLDASGGSDLTTVVAKLWPQVTEAADRRQRRLGHPPSRA